MNRAELVALSLQGLLAWLVLSALGWYFGGALGQCLLPGFGFIINQICPDYSSWLTLLPENHDFTIQLSAIVVNPVLLGDKLWLNPGLELTVGTHLMHTLVPLVIQVSILLVWPVKSWRKRVILLVLGLVTSVFVLGLTAPFLLLGNLEVYLLELAEQAKVHRPEPWTLSWMIFCEMGGRWLLPIVAAVLCIKLQQAISTSCKKIRLRPTC